MPEDIIYVREYGKEKIITKGNLEIDLQFGTKEYVKSIEVLGPVPSYQKYAAMKAGIILAKNIIDHMEEENMKLKNLLREARIYVAIDTQDYEDRAPSKNDIDEARTLLKKIDEVLK